MVATSEAVGLGAPVGSSFGVAGVGVAGDAVAGVAVAAVGFVASGLPPGLAPWLDAADPEQPLAATARPMSAIRSVVRITPVSVRRKAMPR
jgi:hypothetical protein